MGFEHLEEIARLGQQALKPGEHRTNPRVLRNDAQDAGASGRCLEFGRSKRPDEVAEIGLIDCFCRFFKREPAPFALVLFLPRRQFARDRQREHIDIDHQRSAVAAALAIAKAAERGGADRAGHPGFFLRLARGGKMRRDRCAEVALGDDPPLRFARGDEHQPDLCVGRRTFEAIRQGGNLSDDRVPVFGWPPRPSRDAAASSMTQL
jgi:hypothetical protein